MRVLLQFPEGLKQRALEHARRLESDGDEVFISASPTFGACDLALDEARRIGADRLIHFGHAEFHKVDFDVEYVECADEADLDILERSLGPLAPYRTIGVVTTIQHIGQLGAIVDFYKRAEKKVVVGRPYGFAKREGQILGCDVGSAATIDRQVDAFVYFGGGEFHPLGALLATTKPFLVVEPYRNSVGFIDGQRDVYRKRSRGRVMSALDAGAFGILVSTKNGQHNMALGRLLKSRIEGAGLEAQLLVANTFDFDSLNNMLEFGAFVNTACPRLAIDDTDRLRRPLLSANELMEVLGIRSELKGLQAKAKR